MEELYWLPFYGGHQHLKIEKLPLKQERVYAVPSTISVHMSPYINEGCNPLTALSFEEERYVLRELSWPGISDLESRISGEELIETWWIYVLNNDPYFLEEISHHWYLFIWMGQ